MSRITGIILAMVEQATYEHGLGIMVEDGLGHVDRSHVWNALLDIDAETRCGDYGLETPHLQLVPEEAECSGCRRCRIREPLVKHRMPDMYHTYPSIYLREDHPEDDLAPDPIPVDIDGILLREISRPEDLDAVRPKDDPIADELSDLDRQLLEMMDCDW